MFNSLVLYLRQNKILKLSVNANIHIKNEQIFLYILNLIVFMLIFHISDFHYLKIVNNVFFIIFEGGLIYLSRGVLWQSWNLY